MSLSCSCEDDYDWWYNSPDDYSRLLTRKRRRCISCKVLIDIGATCAAFSCWRNPKSDIEENIYGDEVPLANKYMCEECADLYFSLEDLGFCITLGDDMRDLTRDYAELYGTPQKAVEK